MDATKKSNALVPAERPAALLPINNVQELQFLGTVLSQSQLFGQSNPAEGLAIVAMCHQKRISWMDFMQNFHMIKGRVSKKTDAILADFHRMGGKHEITSRTADLAEAKFILGKTSYVSKISWEDCKAEPFIYQGAKEEEIVRQIEAGNAANLVIKAKYRTPRARMQMLWARCVSDGVRAVAPECVQGIYTPEEVEDFTDDQNAAPVATQPVQVHGVSSPSPVAVVGAAQTNSVEFCPVGPATGKRWDDESVFNVETLKQALAGTHPLLTPEMKDYIRGLVEKRQPVAAAVAAEVEVVNA